MPKGHDAEWWRNHPEARQRISDANKGNSGGTYERTPEVRLRVSESVKAAFRERRRKGLNIGRPQSATITTSTCRVCQKDYQHRDDETGQYCGVECRSLGVLLRGSSYRNKGLKFLPHVCERCNKNLPNDRDIIVHHADENRLNNDLDNLQIVCIPCHTKLHRAHVASSRLYFGDRAIRRGVIEILRGLRLDLHDENLRDTPLRVSRMFLEMFEGLYRQEEVAEILATTFPSDYDGIITHEHLLANSMCPHHLLPVEYDIAIGYMSEMTVGLSKLPRVVELMAKRPVLQETLTREIAITLEEHLKASAMVVIVRGKHACMRVRGVRSQTDVVTTSEVRGHFRTDASARSEVMALLKGGRGRD